jgi:hypothetical protein
MQTTKRTVRKAKQAARNVQHVVKTTVGDLISSLMDAVGTDGTLVLLTATSPLQRHLRQRVVVE